MENFVFCAVHEDENNLKRHYEKEIYIRFKRFVLWYYTNIVIKA